MFPTIIIVAVQLVVVVVLLLLLLLLLVWNSNVSQGSFLKDVGVVGLRGTYGWRNRLVAGLEAGRFPSR